MIAVWEKATWQFVEGPRGLPMVAVHSAASAVPPAAHVATRSLMVQDYPEGGVRCLDVEKFVRGLCMRHVRRLLDPVPQSWKGMAMHFLERCYGELRQGLRLLVSACDFLAVLRPEHSVPAFWQTAMVAWGMWPPPVPLDPTVEAPKSETARRQRASAEASASVGLHAIMVRGAQRVALPQRQWMDFILDST